MTTLVAKRAEPVRARCIRFLGGWLLVELSDGRQLRVPYRRIPWLKWLAKASPKQRADWSLEPGGYAVYWKQLDDGVEICHLLAMNRLT
jgi:hypothetical protein